MSDPRKMHAGKDKFEKIAYEGMLKTQRPEAPTYEPQETESTNSVINDEADRSSIKKPKLKKYEPEKSSPLKDILVGIIISLISLAIFAICMSLYREVGVVSERSTQNGKMTYEIKEEVKKIKEDVTDLKIEVEVLKRNEMPRGNQTTSEK